MCSIVIRGTLLNSDQQNPLDYYAQTPEMWAAKWIGSSPGPDLGQSSPPNLWLCFRGHIDLDTAPAKAVARIAVDSKYWLWVNGELVIFEGGLKRGPAPDATWYDRVDIQRYLRRGRNCFAILLWHFGNNEGVSHQSSGCAGLLFDAKVDDQNVSSSKTWRAIKHPAYGDTGEPHPNWRLTESNIHFDARNDIDTWHTPDYDDSDWPSASELGSPPSQPFGHLIQRTIPQWKDSGLLPYQDVQVSRDDNAASVYKGRLPYNAQITPYLDIECPAGLTIDMRADSYIDGSEPSVRAEYVTKAGRQQYESLGWFNGHQVHYTVPSGVKVQGLKYRETGYDTQVVGRFDCDDADLNTLWKKSARTLYLNMRDTFMDTPGRERAQWWGDVVLMMTQAMYACDDRTHALVRKAIMELAAWQRSDNVLFSPIPAGIWRKELPMQMLASVGHYGFWNYYWYTADAELIDRVYPAVASYMDVWGLDKDGLVIQRPGDWTWGDWGDNKDLPLLYNGWYALALRGQRAMAELTGRTDEIASIDNTLSILTERFPERYFNGECLRSDEHTGPPDDRGNALAVLAGLMDQSHHASIIKVLETQQHASSYMEKYVLEALYRMGRPDIAVSRMKRRYKQMIDSPLTTLWEGWELGDTKYGGGTCNHAWSGGPLILLSQFAAGIEPIEPGYRVFQVRPMLGPLRKISATVPTVRGLIEVRIQHDDDRAEVRLTVPPGSRCVVFSPITDRQPVAIKCNGQAIVDQADGIEVDQGESTLEFCYE
jgi:alpha-L-rhamnosidase